MNRPALLAVLLLGMALAPAPARADHFSIGLNLGAPGISIGGFYGGHHVAIPFQINVPLGYYSYPPVYPRTYVYETPAPVVVQPRTYVVRPYRFQSYNYPYDYRYEYPSYSYYPYGYSPYSSYYPDTYYPYSYYPYGYRSGYAYRSDDHRDGRDYRRDYQRDYRRDDRNDRDRDRIDRSDRNDRIQRDSRDNRRGDGRAERINSTQPNRAIERRPISRERFDSFRPQPQQIRPNVEMNRTAARTDGRVIAERSRTLSITRPSAPAGQSNRGNSNSGGRTNRATNAGSRSGGR